MNELNKKKENNIAYYFNTTLKLILVSFINFIIRISNKMFGLMIPLYKI